MLDSMVIAEHFGSSGGRRANWAASYKSASWVGSELILMRGRCRETGGGLDDLEIVPPEPPFEQ